MRHSFITDLVTKGFDLKTIIEIACHKDVRMLIERYTHPNKIQKSLAVKSLDSDTRDIDQRSKLGIL